VRNMPFDEFQGLLEHLQTEQRRIWIYHVQIEVTAPLKIQVIRAVPRRLVTYGPSMAWVPSGMDHGMPVGKARPEVRAHVLCSHIEIVEDLDRPGEDRSPTKDHSAS